jgi:predicted DNA-binding transcriptional regulator AlpA
MVKKEQNSIVSLEPMLRWRDITTMTGASQSAVRIWIKDGLFPAPFYLGPRSPRWRQSVVLAWQEKQREREAPDL